uniref:Uncharacterized protein n=1 Tax=Panagrolaimus sp. JU765 TaxID=591449 RepID=A0AC34QQF4_9BILA
MLCLPSLPPNLCLEPPLGRKFINKSHFLQKLAQKTEDYPLSSLFIKGGVTVPDFQQFLQKVRFADGAIIFFRTYSVDNQAYRTMVSSLGNQESTEVSQIPKYFNVFNRKAILLKENVNILEINSNFTGIYLMNPFYP